MLSALAAAEVRRIEVNTAAKRLGFDMVSPRRR
jgi:hypothetical protein